MIKPTVSALDQSKPFILGTTPHDGTNPQIYSDKKGFMQIYSFLITNYSQQVNSLYEKYLPSAPCPTYLTMIELTKRISQETNFNGWDIYEDGSLIFNDPEAAEKQKGILLQMFGKAIKSLAYSNLSGMSLPARLFDCISMLESIAYSSRYGPYFLSRAAKINDPLERFKLFVAGSIAMMHLSLKRSAALNPLLGETFQFGLEDGTMVYYEQTSHHPPITNSLYIGPNNSYRMYGKIQLEGKMTANTMSFFSLSNLTIVFKDGQQISTNGFPTIKMTGLTVGERHLLYKNSFEVVDKKHGWKGMIFFDYGEKKGILSSEKTVPKDWIEGIIYVPKKSADIIGKTKNTPKCIEELTDIKTEIARVKGSWLRKVEINAVNYWIMDKLKPVKFYYVNNPLPSDSRFREDVVWLRRNNIDYADSWKDSLEIRQRQDAALRAKYAK